MLAIQGGLIDIAGRNLGITGLVSHLNLGILGGNCGISGRNSGISSALCRIPEMSGFLRILSLPTVLGPISRNPVRVSGILAI